VDSAKLLNQIESRRVVETPISTDSSEGEELAKLEESKRQRQDYIKSQHYIKSKHGEFTVGKLKWEKRLWKNEGEHYLLP